MLVRLTGVWQDGTEYDRQGRVPRDARAVLRVAQGQSARVLVQILTPAGVALDLAENDILQLWVKHRPQDTEAVLKLTGTRLRTEGRGWAEFAITPAQTRNVQFGRYLYDVWVTHAGERNQVIPVSAFIVTPGTVPPT